MDDAIIDREQGAFDELLNDEVDTTVDEAENNIEDIAVSNNNYQIYSGEALSCDEIYPVAAKESTKMIVFVGPIGSGKTTIETTIYQLFHESPMGELYFAGSKTILGYEQRAFYTRIKSRGGNPVTPRTVVKMDQSFLHLKLWQKDKDLINNFMFADLSGEFFESHIGQVDEVKKNFPFMDRADYFVGVIDGELLAERRKMRSTVSGIIEMIRTFYDAELINQECVLQVVFSKYDLLSELENIDQIIAKVKESIEGNFEEKFSKIEYFKVAAMPQDTSKFEIGHGLNILLLSWFNKNILEKYKARKEKFEDLSEFDRLEYKFRGI